MFDRGDQACEREGSRMAGDPRLMSPFRFGLSVAVLAGAVMVAVPVSATAPGERVSATAGLQEESIGTYVSPTYPPALTVCCA